MHKRGDEVDFVSAQVVPHDDDLVSDFPPHVFVLFEDSASLVVVKVFDLKRGLSDEGDGTREETTPGLQVRTGCVVVEGKL